MASITKLPGVGKNHLKMLKKARIASTKSLLKKAACGNARKKLAEQTGISESLLYSWAKKAGLLLVKEIKPKQLKVLAKLGVNDLESLSMQEPETFHKKILSLNKYFLKMSGGIPSKKTVTAWIKNAKKTDNPVETILDASFLKTGSAGAILSFQKTFLETALAEEWKRLSVLNQAAKAKAFFDAINLSCKMEKYRTMQKKENLEKESGKEPEKALCRTIFSYALAEYGELIAQEELFRKKIGNIEETFPPEMTEPKKKLFLEKLAEAKLKQVKKELNGIQKKFSNSRKEKEILVLSQECVQELHELFFWARFFTGQTKKQKVIEDIIKLFGKIVEKNAFFLGEKYFSQKKIKNILPSAKPFLKENNYGFVLAKEFFRNSGCS